MSETYLRTKNLSVGYDGKALIHDICLDIHRGEIVTLIGPNGSGKSTILKSITRQLRTVAGVVEIDNQLLSQLGNRQLAERMAVVLTARVQPELMTCRDIVATGRYPYTNRLGILKAEDEAIVERSMEQVHALELSDRSFDAISDGQRQRVLLARAICQEPEIIVLDEPTSYLDIRHKLELLTILRTMAREKGITVIMSLHEIDLAQKISDRIICVKGDTIAGFGTPAEVFQQDSISELYEITHGSFDPRFGSIELALPEGEAQVFVLSAGGTGLSVYRALQKENTPFSAGILYTNDMDYVLAQHLASRVITEKPFYPLSDASVEAAREEIRHCRRVINAGVPLGPCNERMKELIAFAQEQGKLESA